MAHLGAHQLGFQAWEETLWEAKRQEGHEQGAVCVWTLIQQNVPIREDFGESGEGDGASVPGESQRNAHSQGFSNTKHSGKCVMSVCCAPGPPAMEELGAPLGPGRTSVTAEPPRLSRAGCLQRELSS